MSKFTVDYTKSVHEFDCNVVFSLHGFVDASDLAEAKTLIEARIEKAFEHPDVQDTIDALMNKKSVFDCSYIYTIQDFNIQGE